MLKHTLSVLAVVALAGAMPAEEYTIKLKSYPDKGQTFVVKESDKNTSDSKIEVNGMSIPDVKKTSKEIEYDLKVVKAGDKPSDKPAEFTRTYAKANSTEGNKTTKLPYSGRTVIFALNKDEYKVSAEGTPEIPEKELANLAKQDKDPIASLDSLLDPGKAVKINDTWNPDKKKLVDIFGKDNVGTIDMDKSKITAKLLKVYDKDKQKWGSIELVMEITIKELPGEAAKLKFSEPAVVKLNMTIERPIDGSSAAMSAKGTMSMTFKGSIEQGGMTIGVESKISGDLARDMTEKK